MTPDMKEQQSLPVRSIQTQMMDGAGTMSGGMQQSLMAEKSSGLIGHTSHALQTLIDIH
jgi:hypothetical protein